MPNPKRPPSNAKPIRFTPTIMLAILAGIIIALTIVLIIISIAVASKNSAIERIYLIATADNVVGATGEVGGKLFGTLTLDESGPLISHDFRYVNISTITALHIRGPILLGSEIGELAFSLCGSPSTLVCDQTMLPGNLKGSIDQISPGNTGVIAEIKPIRENRPLYYLEVLTNNHPTTPGALRAPLI